MISLYRAKLKAFFVHLSLSALIALLAMVLVFVIWHPAPLHRAVGVTEVFFLLLAIDVVLGPLLTMVVYRPQKNTLKSDLSVIVLIQIAALLYGLWTVSVARPAWIVFAYDRFDLVRANDMDRRELHLAQPPYTTASWFGPQWASLRSVADFENRDEIIRDVYDSDIDLSRRPYLYQPLELSREEISQRIRPLQQLYRFNQEEEVQAILARYPQANGWLPLRAIEQNMAVLLEDANVLAVVDLEI